MTQLHFDAGPASLRLREPSERLRAAADEHDKLLARVARRRKARDRLEQDIRVAVSVVAGKIAPLAEEARRLDQEIHGVFEELVADRSRPRRERDEIDRLYRELHRGGIISPRGFWAAVPDPGATEAAGDECDEIVQPSAPRPADGHRGPIRDLYRQLAKALHPDRVQDERDKADRTEVMKQITVAYQEGDFARLVEIERRWATSGAPIAGDHDDEVERRCAALQRATEELRKQLRGIERDLRALRRSAEAQIAKDLQQVRDAGEEAGITAEMDGELSVLRRMHDFVRSFRDGRISLETFLDGPDADLEDENGDDFAEIVEVLAELMMAADQDERREAPKRRRRRRRRR